ncbi:hypothetical protein S83_064807, partial [Arachis hypogaea]
HRSSDHFSGDAAVAAIMPVVVSCRPAILELGVSILTKTFPFTVAFSDFGDPILWLVYLAFFAKLVDEKVVKQNYYDEALKPGLGNRVAYEFVSLFESSLLGLGYSLVFSEVLLALTTWKPSSSQLEPLLRRPRQDHHLVAMVATVSCRRTLKLVATHLLPSQNAGLVRRARHQHPCCSVCKL